MKRYAFLIGGLLMAGTLLAADAPGPRLSSPVLGYVFDDAAQSIRAVSGVAGAASFGDTVHLPAAVTSALVHSGARLAVVVTKEGGLQLASWGNGVHVYTLDSALGSLQHAAFNSSASRVVLSDGPTVEIWSTGDGTHVPALVSRHHADSAVTALAVSNDGVVVAAIDTGLLTRISTHGAETLANGAEWSAVAFAGADVIAADATHKELVKVSAEGGRSVIVALPESASAVAVAADGGSFAVALSGSVLLISNSGTILPTGCECQPKGLDSLEGNLIVHIRGTAWLLDAATGEPRLTQLPNLYVVNAGGAN
jgi:hypothetical protein